MKKIKYFILIIAALLVGCSKDTNNSDNQYTTRSNQQTSQIQISTKEADTTKDITTEETTPTTPAPTEAALAIREVLKNERPFIDTDNGYKETYRNDYSYFQGNSNANIGWGNFTMLDINNDGNREIKITVRNLKYDGNKVDINDTTRMIFRYYNGKVYGYQCSKITSLRNDEYFIWDSENLYLENDIKYKGGGKIEFDGEKIKFIYYTSNGDIEAKKWLEALMQNMNIEVIEDSKMNVLCIQKCDDRNKYDAGDSNLLEDIDAYIY